MRGVKLNHMAMYPYFFLTGKKLRMAAGESTAVVGDGGKVSGKICRVVLTIQHHTNAK